MIECVKYYVHLNQYSNVLHKKLHIIGTCLFVIGRQKNGIISRFFMSFRSFTIFYELNLSRSKVFSHVSTTIAENIEPVTFNAVRPISMIGSIPKIEPM